ncbi:MAG: hypothetical protein ACXQS2_04300 [Methermicoccaceae archaeon]
MEICPVCKKPFVPSKMQMARIREGKRVYCSRECYIKGKSRSAAELDKIYDKCVELIDEKIRSEKYREYLRKKLDEVFIAIDFQNLYRHVKSVDKVSTVARAVVQTILDMEHIGVKVILIDGFDSKAVRVIKDQLNLRIIPDYEKTIYNQIEMFCDALNISFCDELHRDAKRILDRLKREKNVYGSPVTIGASIIYFLMKDRDDSTRQKDVGEFFGISDYAMRSFLRSVEDVLIDEYYFRRR